MSERSWSQVLDDAGWHPDYHDSDTQHDENVQAIDDDQYLSQHPDAKAAALAAAGAVQGGSRAEDEIHAETNRDNAVQQKWKDAGAYADGTANAWYSSFDEGTDPDTGGDTSITAGNAKGESQRRERWQVDQASKKVSSSYAGGAFTAFANATTAAVTGATPPPADGSGSGAPDTSGDHVDYAVVLPTLTRASGLVQQCVGEYGATATALATAVQNAAAEVGKHHEQDMVENFNDFSNYAFSLMLTLQDIGEALNGLHTLTDQTHDNYQKADQDAAAGMAGQHG